MSYTPGPPPGRSGHKYSGSPTVLLVLVALVVVAGIWAAFSPGPSLRSMLASANVSNSLRTANNIQNALHTAKGAYLNNDQAQTFLGTKAIDPWPSGVNVVATCSDGFVLSSDVGGTKRYMSSVNATIGGLGAVSMPDCIQREGLDAEPVVPDEVTDLTVAHSDDAKGGALHEAVKVSWTKVDQCPAVQKPTYQVSVSNVDGWRQKVATYSTDKDEIVVPSVWNGAAYNFSVRAQCSELAGLGPSTKDVEFKQALPTPTMNLAAYNFAGPSLRLTHTKVSSSPWVSYQYQVSKGGSGDYADLINLKEPDFTIFPPAETYRYRWNDQFRVSAEAESGQATGFSGPVAVSIVR